jgi:hypothetical protein
MMLKKNFLHVFKLYVSALLLQLFGGGNRHGASLYVVFVSTISPYRN